MFLIFIEYTSFFFSDLLKLISREPADELLYRLKETEKVALFVKTVDTLGLGPIDFATHVRKHIRVNMPPLLMQRRLHHA